MITIAEYVTYNQPLMESLSDFVNMIVKHGKKINSGKDALKAIRSENFKARLLGDESLAKHAYDEISQYMPQLKNHNYGFDLLKIKRETGHDFDDLKRILKEIAKIGKVAVMDR